MTKAFDCSVLQEVIAEYVNINLYPMLPQDVVFEERVQLNCFYCKHYNYSWRCPPRIPPLNYERIIKEYNSGVFAELRYSYTEATYSDVRVSSTNDLHRALLKLENYLWEHNNPLALAFIGGSCKLCKGGCGVERCNNPYLARMSMEAAGINVIKSVEKYGITVVFPPDGVLVRVGMLLW